MRLAPGGSWRSFRAWERFSGSGVDFRWRARFHVAPLVDGSVVDAFEGGAGFLRVCLFGFIPIVRSRGTASDRGEALRGLAELPWRPWAFREAPPLSWESAEPCRLRGTFDDGRTRVSAEFELDPAGHVLAATVADRPRVVGTSTASCPWSGVFRGYRRLNGIVVPTYAEASWHLVDGIFTYWRARLIEFHLLR